MTEFSESEKLELKQMLGDFYQFASDFESGSIDFEIIRDPSEGEEMAQRARGYRILIKMIESL